MNDQIAILYGPTGGNTERVAQLIAEKIGTQKCQLIPVKEANESSLNSFSKVIVGGSTIGKHNWSHENPSVDWDEFLPTFRKINFAQKKVAIFGLGDQLAYPNNFVDEMRVLKGLHKKETVRDNSKNRCKETSNN